MRAPQQPKPARPIGSSVTRALAVGLVLGALGCAGRPALSVADPSVCHACAAATSPGGPSAGTRCEASAAAWSAAPIGGVQQTRGQTRTVGVPRGFLILMIVLFVLIAA